MTLHMRCHQVELPYPLKVLYIYNDRASHQDPRFQRSKAIRVAILLKPCMPQTMVHSVSIPWSIVFWHEKNLLGMCIGRRYSWFHEKQVQMP